MSENWMEDSGSWKDSFFFSISKEEMLENSAPEWGAECSNCLPTQKLENRASKLDQWHVLFGAKE